MNTLILLCLLPTSFGVLTYEYTNPQGPFTLRWGFSGSGANEIIDIEFTLPGEAYQGIAFPNHNRMDGDDVVMGWVYHDGTPRIVDTWDFGSREPVEDIALGGRNDITVVSGSVDSWMTTLRFTRKLVTGDKNDADIVKGVMELKYAWCDSPNECSDEPGEMAVHRLDTAGFVDVDMSGRNARLLSPPLQ